MISEIKAAPPVADQRPVEITQHGKTRVDPYAWLHDENWQEVLRDPSTLEADIRQHLEAEVAYYEKATAPLEDLRQTIFKEVRGRIKEDESSVPMPDGPYEYYTRFRKGGDYPVFARRARGDDRAAEEVIFDSDAERGDSAFFDIGSVIRSPDHTLTAYATDRLGSEYYDIRIRRLKDGLEWEETIPSTSGEIVWSKDGKGFFYVERDDNQRPKRVKFHALGTGAEADPLVYEESDDAMDLWIDKTSPETYLVIGLDTGETSEAWVVPLDAPETAPHLIAPRLEGQLYDIDHAGDYFYIRTNADGAVDFKIMRAPATDPGRAHWQDWVPHQQGVYLTGFALFEKYIVREERENARPRMVVGDYDGNTHEITMNEAAYALYLVGWDEFKTDIVRFAYESPSVPKQIFDYRMDRKERFLRKTQTVPSGHNESLYAVDVVVAKGEDGAEIPVTVLRLKRTPLDGSAPLFLYGYGSYGSYDDDGFSVGVLSLVDRGVVYARAHIRGGSAKGRHWYLDGKFGKKENSFRDFNAAARAVIERNYTRQGKIIAYGASAGGLLVGAAINLAPELYAGILADVPFVDVLT
ncbi:MAG: S9 family peptidase, partial [Geminicoccaceae bacterium]